MKIAMRIDMNHPHTVTGTRQAAHRKAKAIGAALWVRACGKKAVLFYYENGRRRQKTYTNLSLYFGA